MMSEEKVILVNEHDEVVGEEEKLLAHSSGLLHRAFSVFLFNDKGQWLMQKRAASKYHSGGLWTNTCCSHPRPNEVTLNAAHRRLQEEMGIECRITYAFPFLYKASLENNLIEHELDHVFVGNFNGIPEINPSEVEDWKFMENKEISRAMMEDPNAFTVWFKLIYPRIVSLRESAPKT